MNPAISLVIIVIGYLAIYDKTTVGEEEEKDKDIESACESEQSFSIGEDLLD